jgi:hypothetical protein
MSWYSIRRSESKGKQEERERGVKLKHEGQRKNLRSRNGCWTPVAHTYNPSYLGGRDQEDHGSQKRAAGVAQGAGP